MCAASTLLTHRVLLFSSPAAHRPCCLRLKVPNAIFVGSGLGAHVVAHAIPALSAMGASGFLLCDLSVQKVGDSWWIKPPAAIQASISSTSQPVGMVDRAAEPELASLLDPCDLWRNAVQVVRDAPPCLATTRSHPHSCHSFIHTSPRTWSSEHGHAHQDYHSQSVVHTYTLSPTPNYPSTSV